MRTCRLRVREKINQLCKEMGVEPNLDKFSGRKQLQKLTYLMEAFGLDLGFKFSWYIHGPYDRRLTSVLYDDDPEECSRQVSDEYANEKERLRALKKFLGNDVHSSRILELISSLHYLLLIGIPKKVDDDTVISNLLDLKPQFSEEETRYYLKKIKETLFD